MASRATVILVGYLGEDPKLTYTPGGDACCNFSVAVGKKDRQGTETTTWFRVTAWGKTAEACQQYLLKGKQVYLEGQLSTRDYTDRNGVNRTSLDVTAHNVTFLGAGDNTTGTRPAQQSAASAQQSGSTRETPQEKAERVMGLPADALTDDDIPF